jgi:hypothetical protein
MLQIVIQETRELFPLLVGLLLTHIHMCLRVDILNLEASTLQGGYVYEEI